MVADRARGLTVFAILTLALVLDAVLGEPRWLWNRIPHPAVLMGRAVTLGDRWLNRGPVKQVTGSLLMFVLIAIALGIGLMAQGFGWVIEVVFVAIMLAHKSLIDHVSAVADALRLSLGDGRRSVAMIVGRDTRDMNQHTVARAAIESAAENFSDGVVAPAFWYLLGGMPGLLIYKVTNTADSMIGYRTPRHEAFGWAAARFDDLLNLIPARLTALLFALSFGHLKAWKDIYADARLHRSPNAGWPEAALSRALGVALSGPRAYDGQMHDLPFVNTFGRRDAGPNDIDRASQGLWTAWGIGVAIVLCLVILV